LGKINTVILKEYAMTTKVPPKETAPKPKTVTPPAPAVASTVKAAVIKTTTQTAKPNKVVTANPVVGKAKY
jgi:hypothetical protein